VPISPRERQLVLVTGPPAAGKTTVGGPLAAELGFALLAKDRIKETLQDALGGEPDLAWSRRLGGASMELLWALASDAAAIVLEANFWPDDPRTTERIRALAPAPVEVHCQCPLEECMRRYASRASGRHPVHLDGHEQRSLRENFARSARPLGLGPVITADTTEPVDVADLAIKVRQLLPPASTPS
jgi:predicted kinase